MTHADLTPLAQKLETLLQYEKSERLEILKEHLQELCELYRTLARSSSFELENALQELHINFWDVTRTLFNFKDKLNAKLNAHIEWSPVKWTDQGYSHAHLINSLQLQGTTVWQRVKNLKEKHPEILAAIDSEGMACLVLGKILGYEWEINVNNPELTGILKDARNELKYSTVPRELLAQYDQLLIQSGISKNTLIKEFGIDPKDIKPT